MEILAICVTILIAGMGGTWILANKISGSEKSMIKGQNSLRHHFEQALTTLKEYVDSKLVPLEKKIARLEGRQGIKTDKNGDEIHEKEK